MELADDCVAQPVSNIVSCKAITKDFICNRTFGVCIQKTGTLPLPRCSARGNVRFLRPEENLRCDYPWALLAEQRRFGNLFFNF
jgi:hypothetical protein